MGPDSAPLLVLALVFPTQEEIFSSSFAAAGYLSSTNFNKTAYVIGEQGILDELDIAGIKYKGGPVRLVTKCLFI